MLRIFLLLCLGSCSLLRAQQYQVGDVVINDNDGSSGVVFWLSPDESHGWMVALHDVEGKHAWGRLGQNTSVPDFHSTQAAMSYLLGQKDTAGYSNTRTLIQEIGSSSPIFAAKTVDFDHGWYLPASGQLSMLNSAMPLIADAILNEGGEMMEKVFYWSSTECNADEAWSVIQVSGMLSTSDKDYTYTSVRPIRSFINKPIDADASLHLRWNTNDTLPNIRVKPLQTTEYSVVAENIFGCQGKASKTVLLNAAGTQEIFDTLCQGQAYNNNGFRLDTGKIKNPGDYLFDTLLGNDANCRMEVKLFLHVNENARQTVDTSFCKGKTFGYNGKTYVEPGEYTQHFSAFNHCDSTLLLRLTEVEGARRDVYKTDTNSSFWIDQYYYASGDYTRNYTSQNGCDSTETLHLTIVEYYPPIPPDSIYDTVDICSTELPYTYLQKVFTEAGSYSFFANDTTLLLLELIVREASYDTIEQAACQQIVYQGVTYTRDTTFDQTLVNAAGCDSLICVKLKVHKKSSSEITQKACQEVVYDGKSYTRDTLLEKILSNSHGCDSTVKVQIIILHPKSYETRIPFCQEYIYDGLTITKDTTIEKTLVTVDGCDSLLTLHFQKTTILTEEKILHGCEEVIFDGQSYTRDTSFVKTLTSSQGCDSLLTLSIFIHHPTTFRLDIDTCEQYTYDGITFTRDTTFTRNLVGTYGCDSLLTVAIKLRKASSYTLEMSACEEISYQGVTYTRDTTFDKTLVNAAGCDSLLRLVFHVFPNDTGLIEIDSLDHITYKGVRYRKDTVLYEHYSNQWGCDSVMEVRLRVISNYPECTIVVYWGKVLALANPLHHDFLKTASYQWSHNGQQLSGDRDYIEVGKPVPEGEYQVIATWAGGQMTRERFFPKSKALTLSPNPLKAADVLVIRSGDQPILEVEVFDAKGQRQSLNIEEYNGLWRVSAWKNPGLYLLRLSYPDQSTDLHKIIVSP